MDAEAFATEFTFDASHLTSLKTLLHQVNQEHMELKSQLDTLLNEHNTVLSEYAERSLHFRAALKNAKKEARAAVPPERICTFEEKGEELRKLQSYKERSEDVLSLRLFKNELYEMVLKNDKNSQVSLDDYEISGRILKPIVIRKQAADLFNFIRNNYSFTEGHQAMLEALNIYLSHPNCKDQVECFFNECELFSSFFIWKGHSLEYDWLTLGRESFAHLLMDPFITECERVQCEFDAMALDRRTSEKLNQRIISFVKIMEDFSQASILNDRELLQESISVMQLKIQETFWNVMFAYQMIDPDAIPPLRSIIDHYVDVFSKHCSEGELNLERMRCLHWVLGMSLMHIMNAYRRDKLGMLKPAELIALISAIFSDSSLKSACLKEIEEDLLDNSQLDEDLENSEDMEF